MKRRALSEPTRLGRKEWIKYGLTAGVGAFVCMSLQWLFFVVIDSIEDWMAFVVTPGALGVVVIVVATVQWLILRPYDIRLGGWLLASMAAVAAVPVVMCGSCRSPVDWLFTGRGWPSLATNTAAATAAVPLFVGVGQWLVLRRHVARAGWWVLASAVGGLAGTVGGWIL